MVSKQELQVQQKRQVEDKEEATIPVRQFLPNTDIYETETALTVVLEMPGVEKTNVEVAVEGGVLKVYGRIDFSKYEGLQYDGPFSIRKQGSLELAHVSWLGPETIGPTASPTVLGPLENEEAK